mmetsp:Transcript_1230/g.2461  ORF Transcript_1230/g.2461 Transcript_1230/m.2461 type:complete len:206 (+) Transcript_1230:1085-1702(+)
MGNWPLRHSSCCDRGASRPPERITQPSCGPCCCPKTSLARCRRCRRCDHWVYNSSIQYNYRIYTHCRIYTQITYPQYRQYRQHRQTQYITHRQQTQYSPYRRTTGIAQTYGHRICRHRRCRHRQHRHRHSQFPPWRPPSGWHLWVWMWVWVVWVLLCALLWRQHCYQVAPLLCWRCYSAAGAPASTPSLGIVPCTTPWRGDLCHA